MGDLDSLSREFAREHSERLWKQLVVVQADASEPRAARKDAIVAFALAVAAAAMVKAPALFGIGLEDHNEAFYLHNVPLFILPLLTGYFAWKRRLDAGVLRWLAVAFVGAAVFANVYPWVQDPATSETRPPVRLDRGRFRCCTCRWRSGLWWASRTRVLGGVRWRAGWTSFDSRASSSSTTC